MSFRREFALSFHVLAGGAALLVPSTARGTPQASAGLTTGGVVEDVVGPHSIGGAFHLGIRGDVLFLRSSPRDMGLGPYVDASTASFATSDVGGGLSWLVPAIEDLPLVVSAGAFARNGEGRSWAPGVEANLFGGSRSYNYHSSYGMAVGLFVQTRWVPLPPATLDVVIGVQLDLELLALPVVGVISAIKN